MRKIYFFLVFTLIFIFLFSLVFFYFWKNTSPENNSLPPIFSQDPSLNTFPINTQEKPPVSLSTESKKNISSFYTGERDLSLPIRWLYPQKNTDASSTSLEQLSQYKEFSLPESIFKLVRPLNYSLFRCDQSKNSSFGLQINLAVIPDYPGNTYLDMKKNLNLSQEEYIASLWTVLFPNDQKQSSALINPYKKQYIYSKEYDLDYNKATYITSEGKKVDVYYGIVENYILFTTSEECLKNASGGLYDLVP